MNKFKYFPWSPGIPWKIKKKIFISPELPFDLLCDAFRNKKLVVCAFGGLLESYYSLSILECLNKNFPNKLYWVGNPKYHDLVIANGLAEIFDYEITSNDLIRFPTPIFFDQEDHIYFNCLSNYLKVHTFYLSKGYKDRRPVIQQIVEKSTINWDKKYLPVYRNTEKFKIFKMYSIDVNKPFVLLLPNHTNLSNHNLYYINWNDHQVKSFIVMMQQLGLQVILLSANPEKYWGLNIKILPVNISTFMSLAPFAKLIISKDVDFPIISCSLSEAKLACNKFKGPFSLHKNIEFLNSDQDIYSEIGLTPVDIYNWIRNEY